tara:strand:- start:7432 stop:8010 length:579 start_codon:yes stop_codon:yes gene_type:complete
MKKYILLLFTFFSGFLFSQEYNNACLECAEAQGFYCGDDESNWTEYSPNGCVQTTWIADGWEDCVDASDEEQGQVPTTMFECLLDEVGCDTVYVDVIEYINLTDTIIEIQVIEEIDTVYVYEDILDTLYIYETEWIYIEEFVDCDTGLPCNTNIIEIIEDSKGSDIMFNLKGQSIRKPESIYIQNGKVKWLK